MTAPVAAVGVVLVAAGSGTRLGRGEAKAFVPIAGEPMLLHALRRVDAVQHVREVVVVAPVERVAEAAALAVSIRVDVRVVAGGDSRHASVAAGLAALTDAVDVVLVHDAARYDAPAELFERVVAEVVARGDGVVPGLPVADTVKRVDPGGLVVDTPDRAVLRAVQTPQGFPLATLRAAYAATDSDYTDDAAVWAAAGGAVRVVAGDARATKVTTPHDLSEAERRHGGEVRTGSGMDVHAFGDGEMHLAGLHWPGGGGLAGHSDGDAAAHALCDALLAAAGLGDIGQRYGTADPAWAGASGVRFLEATRELLLQHGWRVGNATVQIVGVRPRVGPRRAEAEQVLGAALRAPVSVSATTTDGLGSTGRGEGVAAFATALLHRVAGPAGAPIALTP